MPTVSLKAHYDGKTIRLDEPFDLPPNTRLMVTVLPPMTDTGREDWSNLSAANLARAYGDDEPEYEHLSGCQPKDQPGQSSQGISRL